MAKAYLVVIEHQSNLNSAAGLYRRLSEINGNRDLMDEIMMENIWEAFYEDKTAVHISRAEVSKELWGEWEALTLRKGVQEKILIKAYKHFRRLNPRRNFRRKIELYADNSFGGKIRDRFMRGGREDNGE